MQTKQHYLGSNCISSFFGQSTRFDGAFQRGNHKKVSRELKVLCIRRYRVQEGIMSNLLAESSAYTQLGFFYDLLDGNGFEWSVRCSPLYFMNWYMPSTNGGLAICVRKVMAMVPTFVFSLQRRKGWGKWMIGYDLYCRFDTATNSLSTWPCSNGSAVLKYWRQKLWRRSMS